MHSRSTLIAVAQHRARRGLDRGPVAGGDALLIDQRAAHADERRAGRQIGGDIARLHAAGRAERHIRATRCASARICAGPPTETPGNTFTTSAPAASAARTSVGVRAPSISTAPACRHGSASAGIDPRRDDEARAGVQTRPRGRRVRHGAGADQQRRVGGQLADQRRRIRGWSW